MRFIFKMAALAVALLAGSTSFAAECDAPINEQQTRKCIGDELRESDVAINAVYRELMNSFSEEKKGSLKLEQRKWIKDRTKACGIDASISDREQWIDNILQNYSKTICVVSMTRKRIGTLRAMAHGSTDQATTNPIPRNDQKGEPSPYDKTAYGGRKPTIHANGKWYFEFTLNKKSISQIAPALIVMGVSDKALVSGTMVNVTGKETDDSLLRIGVAADFDNGKIYTSRNGVWDGGKPGSNEGSDLKLGRDYYSVFMISARDEMQEMLSRQAFIPNFGDVSFAYAIPDGYRPWRNPLP